jgi:lauroyl/myristoyl acyltransferase
MIWFYRITSLLAGILPINVALFITKIITDGAYHLTYRKVRPIVESNLKVVLDQNKGPHEIKKLTYTIFQNFARFIYEFLRLPWLGEWDLSHRIVMYGIDKVDRALEQGKGVIVLTAHIGNWELGASTLVLKGYPLTVVALRHSNPLINRFFCQRRIGKGLRVCYLDNATRVGLKILRRNECLAILGDRDYTGSGVEVPFFGRKVRFPTGPVNLARHTGASLIPAFAICERDRLRYHITFEDPIELVRGQDKEQDLRTNVGRWVAVLERVISEHPEQWFVFQPVWQDTPDDLQRTINRSKERP